jgi:hypothetical protein
MKGKAYSEAKHMDTTEKISRITAIDSRVGSFTLRQFQNIEIILLHKGKDVLVLN